MGLNLQRRSTTSALTKEIKEEKLPCEIEGFLLSAVSELTAQLKITPKLLTHYCNSKVILIKVKMDNK